MLASATVQTTDIGGGAPGLMEIQVVLDPVFEFTNPADAETYDIEYSPNQFFGVFSDGFEHGETSAWSSVSG